MLLLSFGVFLTLFGGLVLYDASRVRPGDESRPGWHRTTGRVIGTSFEPGAIYLGPGASSPPRFLVEYEFDAAGQTHRGRQAVREAYIVRVKGFTRRLGSLKEGEESPVWYHADGALQSTVMPDAVVGTVVPRQIGWASLLLGLAFLWVRFAAI